MLSFIRAGIRGTFRSVRNLVRSNKLFRNLLYDLDSVAEFTDLYEHERMIADAARVNTYQAAIARHIKPDHTVIDLGTGTGILGCLAAKQKAKVYAIDHSNFIQIAKQIAEHNQLHNIYFVKTNSRSFTIPDKVDVILHEQMGDEIFTENMIENLLDLRQRLLKPDGKILPAQFELFFEPVCLKQPYKIPYIWQNDIHGIDFTFLKDVNDVDQYKHDDYEQRHIDITAIGHFLCDPEPMFAFDLNTMNGPNDMPRVVRATREVKRAGALDGLCVYFRAWFDDEISLSTSPLEEFTHWGNRLFRFDGRHFESGATISYELRMEELVKPESWQVTLGQG